MYTFPVSALLSTPCIRLLCWDLCTLQHSGSRVTLWPTHSSIFGHRERNYQLCLVHLPYSVPLLISSRMVTLKERLSSLFRLLVRLVVSLSRRIRLRIRLL